MAKLSVFHCYSNQHICSAAYFSRLSFKVESKPKKGENILEEDKYQNKSYVAGSIFSTVAFLESSINEMFWEAAKSPTGFVKNLGKETLDMMARTYEESNILKKITTLDKFQFILFLNRKPLFDKGKKPYQDVELLIRLRNELIHFEPEKVDEKVKLHQRLEDKLRNKFALNSFYKGNYLFFPHKCLSYGCAEWAVNSSINFTDDFYNRLNLKPPYTTIRSSLLTN